MQQAKSHLISRFVDSANLKLAHALVLLPIKNSVMNRRVSWKARI